MNCYFVPKEKSSTRSLSKKSEKIDNYVWRWHLQLLGNKCIAIDIRLLMCLVGLLLFESFTETATSCVDRVSSEILCVLLYEIVTIFNLVILFEM